MRAIPTLKISISGVRGVVGESLTPALLVRFAQAFGTYTGPGTIVIGRDTRTSGEMVRQAVVAGLLSSGCRVVDLDICPVPTVQLLVRERRARGGIAITASHNPAEWNALKFINSAGLFLADAQARQLLDIYHQGEYRKVSGTEMGAVELSAGAIDLHVKAILDALGPLPPGPRKLRVAVDSCNGAGSIIAPRLLEALGVEVVALNVTPDGLFPRGAEPVEENLGALCASVREHGCDVGFAQDMDADRLAVVSERGEAIGEEYTLVLATRYVLGRERGPVVANLSTTSALDAVAAQFGCTVFRSKIGGPTSPKRCCGGARLSAAKATAASCTRASTSRATVWRAWRSSSTCSPRRGGQLGAAGRTAALIQEGEARVRSDKIRTALKMVRDEYAMWPMTCATASR